MADERAWDRLLAELDAWARLGRKVTLWWRDDDATAHTPAFERLCDLSARASMPLAVAVIPKSADAGLKKLLADRPLACVLQHGFAHQNHAPEDEKKQELGPHRPPATMIEELRQGWAKLEGFGRIPVLVPPWNRLDEAGLVGRLVDAGFAGLSGFGPRREPTTAGLVRVNTHADIIDWKRSRRFPGAGPVLGQVTSHLIKRRSHEADADEPTGLLTHHALHDEDCWTFLQEFLNSTKRHPAVRWLPTREVFAA